MPRIARDLVPRVRIRFDFQSFHQQWNASTLTALRHTPEDVGIYRIRRNYQPSITIMLARPLMWTTGVSFEQFQTQFPAARIEAANAVINTLRYRRQWQDSDSFRQELDAAYNLRAATKALDSDFVYARNLVSARYSVKHGNNTALVKFIGGAIGGRAPLFERFVLGNTSTLRGWNKFDLDPLGGRHVAHGSLEYRYRFLQVFYDTGAVWDRPGDRQQRHSVGGGFIHDDISLAVAFPLRDGRVTPTFIVSVSF
jgi:Outer membrane protein